MHYSPENPVSLNRLALFSALTLAVACDGLLGTEPLEPTNISSIIAPDTVPAAATFAVSVHVAHGPCERPLMPRVSYVSDTAFFDARVKHDERVFNGNCDADILLGQTFEVSIGPRSPGTLVLRPRPQTFAEPADTVVVQ